MRQPIHFVSLSIRPVACLIDMEFADRMSHSCHAVDNAARDLNSLLVVSRCIRTELHDILLRNKTIQFEFHLSNKEMYFKRRNDVAARIKGRAP
jgi:hypothetical protein